jgi:hypothetical protein
LFSHHGLHPRLQGITLLASLPYPVLRPKLDAHHIYAQEQFVIHIRPEFIVYQNNECLKRVLYYNNIILLEKTNSTLSIR